MGGGLDLTNFHCMAKAMKYKSVLKLFSGYDTEWVCIAHALMKKGLAKGRWAKELRGWTTQDFVILSSDGHIPSRTLRGVLVGWFALAAVLTLSGGYLPTDLSIMQLFYLMNRGQFHDQDELKNLLIWAGTRGLK